MSSTSNGPTSQPDSVGNTAGQPDSLSTTGAPSSAADSQAGNGSTGSTQTVNPVTTVEEPFFIVAQRPVDPAAGTATAGTPSSFDAIEDAINAADDMATLHPGVEIYVLEARKSALSPKPDVQNKDLPQV